MTNRCVPVLAERFHPACPAQAQAGLAVPGHLCQAVPGFRRADRGHLCQAARDCRRADLGQRAGWERPEPETEEWKALPELQALQERSVQPGE